MKKDKIILIGFAILALGSGILGYSGLLKKLTADPYQELKLDAYRVIDGAQLWYIRPVMYGGGGRSFVGLNFKVLGLTDDESLLEWKTSNGIFTFENVQQHTYRLVVIANDGSRFEARNLGFDSRVELTQRSDL